MLWLLRVLIFQYHMFYNLEMGLGYPLLTTSNTRRGVNKNHTRCPPTVRNQDYFVTIIMSFSTSAFTRALPPSPQVYLLLISLPLLVFSEATSFHAGHAVLKIVCSIAFASGPLLVPAEWSPYHLLITCGLLFSLVGDICLIPSRDEYYRSSPPSGEASGAARKGSTTTRDPPKQEAISTSFKLGILAFAGAHIAYILAFLRNADAVSWPSLVSTFAVSMALAKWLGAIYPAPRPAPWNNILNLSIAGEMRPLVSVYATIISSMLAVAAATTAPASSTAWPRQRLLGAAMFVISDLFVAKDAFGGSKALSGAEKAGIRRRTWPKIALAWGLYFGGQMILAGTVYA